MLFNLLAAVAGHAALNPKTPPSWNAPDFDDGPEIAARAAEQAAAAAAHRTDSIEIVAGVALLALLLFFAPRIWRFIKPALRVGGWSV
jgi:hypothetical protein